MVKPLIALTGATGFVGRALLDDLRAHGYRVRVLLRRPVADMPETDSTVIGDLRWPINLSQALEDIDVVVHSAAVGDTLSGRPADDFRAINTDATIALARAARRAGARRFVFLSSVRAQCGPASPHVINETLPPEPADDYGRSKLAAEEGLEGTGLEWTALRSALVYGPGVKGNMAELIRLARTPLPVPLPHPGGRRSLLAVENLAAAVRAVIAPEKIANGPYLVADDDPMSLPKIISVLRDGRGGMARAIPTLPLPKAAFSRLAVSMGKADAIERLAGDLVVDTARLKAIGWRPAVSTKEALRRLGSSAG